jgi:general secretion pathway protein G
MNTRILRRRGKGPAASNRAAFSLLELLAAIAVVAVLASLAFSAIGGGAEAGRRARCISQMRGLATAMLLYTQEHDMTFPRSSHSAYANGSSGWQRDLLPYLGRPGTLNAAEFAQAKRDLLHCPSDKSPNHGSYALNVFFELNPDFDDYEGSPATWRRTVQVPAPSRTVLLAEIVEQSSADHIMAHFWEGNSDALEVASARHQGRSNYVFADGHAETLPLAGTFDSDSGINLWNPALAR